MQLKTLYLLPLAFIFTLSLVDLPPVAALYFPTRLAEGITASAFAFVQQHVPSDWAFRTDEVDQDPENFWRRARELGDTARQYGQKLMKDAAEGSKDVREKIDQLKERMETIVRGATALHNELGASVKRRAMDGGNVEESVASADGLAGDLERAFAKVLEELEVMFPAPDEAPGHEERQRVVAITLEKAGDLVEQHPDLLSALLITGAVMLIPEYLVLRPLLSLFGFGPLGPVKGTTASWAQRVFYGAAVNKGSWFAYLDRAAMTLKAPGAWGWLGGLLGAIGLGGGLFASCGGRK
ncbi:hypothetical protein B0H19DRAFT_960152 [Mycena capillaripes]|nr:hypothetical protein B0H19DRAFT_960152 [Mycena capillaripes]